MFEYILVKNLDNSQAYWAKTLNNYNPFPFPRQNHCYKLMHSSIFNFHLIFMKLTHVYGLQNSQTIWFVTTKWQNRNSLSHFPISESHSWETNTSFYLSTNFINGLMHLLAEHPRHLLEFLKITHLESPLFETEVPKLLSLLFAQHG